MKKDELFYLKYINCQMERNLNSLLNKYEITFQQSHVLLYLIDHLNESINQKKLEEVFSLKPSTMSGIISRLCNKGLIEKKKVNDDNRNNYLVVTNKGLQLYKAIDDNRVYFHNELLKDFNEEEKKNLNELLLKIINNINNIKKGEE